MNSRMWGVIGGLALVLALLSPYILGSSKKVERLFEAAEILYEQNDYEGAITKYSEALRESNKLRARPETIDKDFITLVNFKIAMSYVKLAEHENNKNHYIKALVYIETAAQTVKLAEYEENITYLWGQILYKTGRPEQAVEKLTQLIDNFPNSHFVEEAKEIIAQINEQFQDDEKSDDIVHPIDVIPLWINDLSKFEAFNKKSKKALILPNWLRAEKQYVNAAAQYAVFVEINPSAPETAYALYWAGWCYYEAASDDEALFRKSSDIFQRLVDNYPDNPYALAAHEKLRNMVDSEREIESNKIILAAEQAVYKLQQSGCKSDVISEAIEHLGNAKQEREEKNYEAARQLAKKASDIAKRAINNHERAKQHVNQGYNYLKQGRLELATKKAKEALRIDPSYQNTNSLLAEIKQKYFDQGVSYIEAEEHAKAIPLFKKAINIRSFKEGYYQLGRAYAKSAEFEKAITAAQKALDIDPSYKPALELIDSIDIDTDKN